MLAVIILAAGQSKRMNSKTPKVLHKLGGQTVIEYVLKTAASLNPFQVIVVTSSALKDHSLFKNVTTVVQETAKGTGDAVKSAFSSIHSKVKEILVINGDTPLVQFDTLQELNKIEADLSLIAMPIRNSEEAYGRIICNEDEIPKAIVEYKDATLEQRSLIWANSGVYKIKVNLLKELLPLIKSKNEDNEYYLTDLVGLAFESNKSLQMIKAEADEFQGINTRQDLSLAESILQQRWRQKLMEQGVTLYQPETIFLSHDTKIGNDCCIGPFVTFGPGAYLEHSVTVLPFCHIEQTTIQTDVVIGPFAHTRGKSLLQEGSAIGNFVEVKGATIGKTVKAKHLSYLGDVTVGEGTNIGAGTILCNYNGFEKFKTEIGKNVMVGANSSLISPLKIGDRAFIAAGSVIDQSVPEDALAIARGTQIIKEQGASKLHRKLSKDKKNSFIN